MEQAVRVFGYSGAIVASAFAGALWPVFTDVRKRLGLFLSCLLKAEGRSKARVRWLVLAFGLMVPLGAVLYYALERVTHWPRMTPAALAFSAGTFLYIAVSDLLPHINRHGRDRKLANIGGLLAGVLIMFAPTLALPEDHAAGPRG